LYWLFSRLVSVKISMSASMLAKHLQSVHSRLDDADKDKGGGKSKDKSKSKSKSKNKDADKKKTSTGGMSKISNIERARVALKTQEERRRKNKKLLEIAANNKGVVRRKKGLGYI
jgi:hypothetical protein